MVEHQTEVDGHCIHRSLLIVIVVERIVQPDRCTWHVASHLVHFTKRNSAAGCVKRIQLDDDWKYGIKLSGQFLVVYGREETENSKL